MTTTKKPAAKRKTQQQQQAGTHGQQAGARRMSGKSKTGTRARAAGTQSR